MATSLTSEEYVKHQLWQDATLERCPLHPAGGCSFARLSGSLQEVEAVVVVAEQARTREAAADELRLDIELPGALRWMRRRLKAVHTALIVLLGLFPDLLVGCEPTICAFGQRLGVAFVLPALREIAQAHLQQLPPPLGFRPPAARGGDCNQPDQQQGGPDPPAIIA